MAPRSDFVICTRDRKRDGTFIAEPGDTRFLRVPHAATDYANAKIVTSDRWRLSVRDAADGEEDEVTGTCGDVLVFVHGYNNDIPTVLWRTRTLQQTLTQAGWRGVVVAFDWPSENQTLNYLEDRSDAAGVANRIVNDVIKLLVEAQAVPRTDADACRLNIHLLGHSTGAYVIMEAFAQAQKVGAFYRSDWKVAQVAFIGGDVSSSSLRLACDSNKPMFERLVRFTNYSNPYDKVLGVSNAKRLGTAPRAGRIGLPEDPPDKAVNVDCGAYFLTKDPDNSNFVGTFNHSWHIGDPVFALDLAMTLEGSIDRQAIPTRERTQNGLRLSPSGGARPVYQDAWDREEPVAPQPA
jgi:pimeloyl-ACP methyl ester carboxylesterase